MPIYVGIDLVSRDEVGDSLESHGDRYLHRIYTQRERSECGRNPLSLAGRFAAKEATMKALGPNGIRSSRGVSIEVLDGRDGGLVLALNGPAQTLARARGITNLSVSVTRRKTLAAALVLGEARPGS